MPSLASNAAWLARSHAAVWHPCTQMKLHETLPLVPVGRANGPCLYDFDGRRYLDAVSAWWVNLFAHGHPAINAAIGAQLAELERVMLAGRRASRPTFSACRRASPAATCRFRSC